MESLERVEIGLDTGRTGKWDQPIETREWEPFSNASTRQSGTDIYTDGSLHPTEGSGYAAVILRPGRKLPESEVVAGSLGKRAGIFDSELAALEAAVSRVAELPLGDTGQEIRLWTDSQAAIGRLKRWRSPKPGQHLSAAIRHKVMSLRATGRRVTIGWVKGHSAVPGNEKADEEARKARSNREGITTISFVKKRISDLYRAENRPGQPSRW